MIVIKVWCLPLNRSEDELNCLHGAIVEAAISVSEFNLKNENDMVCLFPTDLMKYGLGEEIIVEISGLPNLSKRDQKGPERLASYVGKSISNLYPKARVVCFVRRFDPSEIVWPPTEAKN